MIQSSFFCHPGPVEERGGGIELLVVFDIGSIGSIIPVVTLESVATKHPARMILEFVLNFVLRASNLFNEIVRNYPN